MVFNGFHDSLGQYIVGDGWEASTEAFAIKESSASLLTEWLTIFVDEWDKYNLGSSAKGDQKGDFIDTWTSPTVLSIFLFVSIDARFSEIKISSISSTCTL